MMSFLAILFIRSLHDLEFQMGKLKVSYQQMQDLKPTIWAG